MLISPRGKFHSCGGATLLALPFQGYDSKFRQTMRGGIRDKLFGGFQE